MLAEMLHMLDATEFYDEHGEPHHIVLWDPDNAEVGDRSMLFPVRKFVPVEAQGRACLGILGVLEHFDMQVLDLLSRQERGFYSADDDKAGSFVYDEDDSDATESDPGDNDTPVVLEGKAAMFI